MGAAFVGQAAMVDLTETASPDVTWSLGATHSRRGGIGTVGYVVLWR